MIFPSSKRAPVPGFKICFNDGKDTERRIFHIDIKDLSKWRDEFKPKRPDNKVKRKCQATGATIGEWTITNSSFVIGNQEGFPIPEPEPGSPDSASSCDALVFTMEELDLFGNTKNVDTIDVEMVAERIKTKRILEGTLILPPNRDYGGEYALLFRSFAARDERANGNRQKSRWEQQSDLIDDGPKGWKFLHDIIFSGQSEADESGKFPAYHPSQRAFILLRSYRGPFLVTYSVRNIDACTHAELLKLIKQMEICGWNDMIYVTQEGDDIPYRIESKKEPEVLEWRGF
ncbi:hypothetical protein IL306_003337 [Fusarium sp. DS 682]|nr:hypothetical protein IL306_003337 [Fusarium sp. DS 682]